MKLKVKNSSNMRILIASAMSLLATSCAVAVGPVQNSLKSSPYAYIYLAPNHMHRINHSSADIKKVALMKLYPVSIREVWSACIDVVSQYDAIWHIFQDDCIILFSQGHKIGSNKKSSHIGRYVDAFMFLHLEARGPEGTAVYLAWLPPNMQSPASIPEPEKEKLERLESLPDAQQFEVTSGVIAQQFYQQLSTQIFSVQEWRRKFIQKSKTY